MVVGCLIILIFDLWLCFSSFFWSSFLHNGNMDLQKCTANMLKICQSFGIIAKYSHKGNVWNLQDGSFHICHVSEKNSAIGLWIKKNPSAFYFRLGRVVLSLMNSKLHPSLCLTLHVQRAIYLGQFYLPSCFKVKKYRHFLLPHKQTT